MGIEGRMLWMIKGMYRVTQNEIITGGGISESFQIGRGVSQGCPLSSILFSLFLDDLGEMWETREEGGTVIGRKKIYMWKFSDDVEIIADTPAGLQEMLKGLEKYCKKNEMIVITKKPKVMVFRNGGKLRRDERWSLNGEGLEAVGIVIST